MFVPWTKEKVIAKMSHILEPHVMLTWVGHTEHKKLNWNNKLAAYYKVLPDMTMGLCNYVGRLRLEIHLHHMNTDGSLLVFCIVQRLFVPTFRKNVPKSPLKLIHPEDGCDVLPWNVKTSVPRCKNPKRDYQWNNIHLENLRTNMYFQFLPQRTLSASPMTKRNQSELFTKIIAYY